MSRMRKPRQKTLEGGTFRRKPRYSLRYDKWGKRINARWLRFFVKPLIHYPRANIKPSEVEDYKAWVRSEIAKEISDVDYTDLVRRQIVKDDPSLAAAADSTRFSLPSSIRASKSKKSYHRALLENLEFRFNLDWRYLDWKTGEPTTFKAHKRPREYIKTLTKAGAQQYKATKIRSTKHQRRL